MDLVSSFLDNLSSLSENSFYEFTIILVIAALLGGIGQMLKQPLIVMFIALGILVGPSFLDIVKSEENIDLLAEVGIAILLFIVGLKLDLRIIQSVGKVALLTGMGQVLFTSLFGYLIALALGFSSMHSFYIAIALTFSSTIIIVKLLSDKKEIDSLHGQIAIGFLIVQDIVVILVMIVLSAMGQNEDANIGEEILHTVIAGAILFGITMAVMKWVIPGLSHFLAKSQEMLSLFAIAWAVALASISELMGFSGEVGAFLAGISLASSDFKDLISSRLVSLRDFLLLFFFVDLGIHLDLSLLGEQIPSALIFSVFVLVGNPIIVLIIMGIMGYEKRTSFLAGLTVAQISEFSLILAGMGLAVGHIDDQVVGLITLVGLITIALSTYLILYSQKIFDIIGPALSIFQRKNPTGDAKHDLGLKGDFDVIIFGLGRMGKALADMIDEHENWNYLGVDFDPDLVREWKKKNKSVLYGDLGDPELLENVPLKKSKFLVSTVKDLRKSKQFMEAVRREKYEGKVYITAWNPKDRELMRSYGADGILLTQELAAEEFYHAFLKTEIKD